MRLPTDSADTTVPQNVTDPTMAPAGDSSTNSVDAAPPEEPCSVCRDGGVMAYPERLVSLNDDSPDLSCREWEGFANAVTLNSADCDLFRLYSSYCGCPPETAVCNVCPNGEHVPNPTRALNWFSTGAFVSTRETTFQQTELDMITCDLMDSFVATEEGLRYIAGLLDLDSDLFCMSVQLKSWICGCSPDWRQYVLTWCYRISGMLSLIVSTTFCVCMLPPLVFHCSCHNAGLVVYRFRCVEETAEEPFHNLSPVGVGHLRVRHDKLCRLHACCCHGTARSGFLSLSGQ